VQDFDDDLARYDLVVGRQIDGAEATLTQLSLDLVTVIQDRTDKLIGQYRNGGHGILFYRAVASN
jgi:hypothetical protein